MKNCILFLTLLAMLQNATAQQTNLDNPFLPEDGTSIQSKEHSDTFSPETPETAPVETNIIDWVTDRDDMSIYPNPVKGLATISFNTSSFKDIRFSIYDSMGNVRWRGILPAGHQTYVVDMFDWAPGVYIVNATINRKAFTLRLIKN